MYVETMLVERIRGAVAFVVERTKKLLATLVRRKDKRCGS